MNNKLALLVAIVLGVLSIVGIQMYIQKIKTQAIRDQELVDVYVATRDIDPGETIEEKDFKVTQMPASFVNRLQQSHVRAKKLLINSKTVEPIIRSQIIQNYHVYAKRAGGADLKFENNWRAITIKVSATSGVAGMIRPGSYVDVMGAFEVQGLELGGVKVAQLTTVLMRKVRVLACDTETDPNSQRRLYAYRTITLRVAPSDATKVVHAHEFGKIILALVNDSETKIDKYYPITADLLLDIAKPELQASKNRRRGRNG